MSPAVLETRSLGTVLVGRPIKRPRQPLAGRVIEVEMMLTDSYLRISVKYQVSTQRVVTASLYIKGIKHGHNRRAAGERGT